MEQHVQISIMNIYQFAHLDNGLHFMDIGWYWRILVTKDIKIKYTYKLFYHLLIQTQILEILTFPSLVGDLRAPETCPKWCPSRYDFGSGIRILYIIFNKYI